MTHHFITKKKYLFNKIIIILFILILTSIIIFLLNKPQDKKTNLIKVSPSVTMTLITPTPITQKQVFLIKGSMPYWDQENALLSFENNKSDFDFISIFWYYLGNDGEIKKYTYANDDSTIITNAHTNNVKILNTITNLPEDANTTWDSKRVENIINNKSLRKKHIEDISKQLNDMDFDGIIIDYESLIPSTKNNFTLFINELAQVLHRDNKILAVALHPKTAKTPPDQDIGAFQDWQQLSKSADQLYIMAYDQHYDNSEAGPIASIEWVKDIIAFSRNIHIPPGKLFLGIPVYGYDWDKDDNQKAEGLTYLQAIQRLQEYGSTEKWDEKASSPFFIYNKEGHKHEVWFENARSILEKIILTEKSGLHGINFWRLGAEDPAIWNILNTIRQ